MWKKFLLIIIMIFGCVNTYAQDLSNITMGEFFQIISKESKRDYYPDVEIRDEILDIDCSKKQNLEDLLAVISELYHLKIKEMGSGFVVSKKEEVDYTLYGVVKPKDYKGTIDGVKVSIVNNVSRFVETKYGGKYIITNLSPGVSIIKFEKEGYKPKYEMLHLKETITALDIELERNNEMKLIEKTEDLEKRNGNLVKKIELNKLEFETLKKILQESFGDRVKIVNVEKSDSILLSGEYREVEAAKKIIEELDSSLKQVRISAQILDVSNNLFESLGFNWLYTQNETTTKDGITFGILSGKGVSGIGEVYNSAIGVVHQFSNGSDILNLGINMLEANQDLVVSARPSILVVDGEKGSFRVVEEVIVGNKKHENNKNEKVDYTPIFKEAGLIFEVTPRIKSNDEILLDTKIEMSNFKLKKQKGEIEDSGTFNSEGGSKVGRSIQTKIKVRDGETVFIGGLKKSVIHNLDSRFPFLGTLPMLKVLFTNNEMGHETSDIYIKLKVEIIKI